MQVDAIVVGAGIWGCTIARRLAEAERRVLVLDRRQTVGGNVRCEVDEETSIEVHAYGSHIFHTHIPEVWDFVNRFVAFNGYQHKVLAQYQGKTYFLPLGLALINKFFGVELKPARSPRSCPTNRVRRRSSTRSSAATPRSSGASRRRRSTRR